MSNPLFKWSRSPLKLFFICHIIKLLYNQRWRLKKCQNVSWSCQSCTYDTHLLKVGPTTGRWPNTTEPLTQCCQVFLQRAQAKDKTWHVFRTNPIKSQSCFVVGPTSKTVRWPNIKTTLAQCYYVTIDIICMLRSLQLPDQ